MSLPISRATVLVTFAAASLMAIGGQILSGNTHPAACVLFAALTGLAMRSRPDRWVLLLLLSHLAVYALGSAPQHLAQWLGAVAVASGIGALHLLTPWLPWQGEHLVVSSRAILVTLRAAGAGALSATATAALASTTPPLRSFGAVLAATSLLLIAAVATLQRREASDRTG